MTSKREDQPADLSPATGTAPVVSARFRQAPPHLKSPDEISRFFMDSSPETCLKDPRTSAPRPPFAGPLGIGGEKTQEEPGLSTEMRYKPDHGEDSYVGFGRLLGRGALVTGGDSGIGRAVALAYAREGADVAIQFLPVEQADAEDTQRLVQEAGRKCVLIPADFSGPAAEGEAACQRVIDTAVAELGHLEILVCNHATQGRTVESFEELTYDRVERTICVNIVAMLGLIKFALPHLKPGALSPLELGVHGLVEAEVHLGELELRHVVTERT